jgi:GT2 family glycosyltransferase
LSNALKPSQTDFPYEVIVVDSSPEPVEPLIKPRFPQVKYVHSERRPSIGEGMNLGVQLAQGEFVAFTHDDCFVPPDWLKRLVNHHQNGTLAAVGGGIANANKHSLAAWVLHLLEFNRYLPGGKRRFIDDIPPCNICYRKSVFEETGLRFPPSNASEHTAVNEELSRRGWKILFDPTISVGHLTRTTWRRIFGHAINLGRAQAPVLKRFKGRGDIFVHYPLLLPLYPPLRLIFGWWNCFRAGIGYTLLFTLLSPSSLSLPVLGQLGFIWASVSSNDGRKSGRKELKEGDDRAEVAVQSHCSLHLPHAASSGARDFRQTGLANLSA